MSRVRPNGAPPAWRVVLDTPVLLQALISGVGAGQSLRRAWQAGQLKPLMSTDTAEELLKVLSWPRLKLTPAAQQELLADVLPYVEVVPGPLRPALRRGAQAQLWSGLDKALQASLTLAEVAGARAWVSSRSLPAGLSLRGGCRWMAVSDLLAPGSVT